MNPEKLRAGATLTIDLDAIADNYRLLRSKAGKAACAAVMKADAYGLGAARIAPVLADAGCRHFFVAHVDEGIALRPHLPRTVQLFILHGPLSGAEQECVAHDLIPVLNSLQQLTAWQRLAARLNRRLPAIVQVDSGMSRMGMSPQEAETWLSDANMLSGIELRYLMSHLACAEVQDHFMNAMQLHNFNSIRQRLPAVAATFANSSGIFLGDAYHFDLVRPGAALYGIAPVAGMPNPMRPVVRLQGKIVQTRTIRHGDHVGYGATYCAPGERQIATVAVGYADGWLRQMSNHGVAFIDGTKVPIVGNVSMDTMTIDVTGIDAERIVPGSPVDLICAEHSVDAVGKLAGTIGYEILTSLGNRFHREYVGGEASRRAA